LFRIKEPMKFPTPYAACHDAQSVLGDSLLNSAGTDLIGLN